MNLKEAIAQAGDARFRCKSAEWLDKQDEATRQEIEEGSLTLPVNTVWRGIRLMGFTGSNDTWGRHVRGLCACNRG